MVPVPWMYSEAGRFLPMLFSRIRPNSFAFPLLDISEYGPFKSFCRDYCLTDSTGLVLREAM